MAFNDIERKRYERYLERFVLLNKREYLEMYASLTYAIRKQSIDIIEIFAHHNRSKPITLPVAKAEYSRRNNNWKVYYKEKGIRWKPYEPNFIVESVQEFLDLVSQDKMLSFSKTTWDKFRKGELTF